jgi:hypothetical protein
LLPPRFAGFNAAALFYTAAKHFKVHLLHDFFNFSSGTKLQQLASLNKTLGSITLCTVVSASLA